MCVIEMNHVNRNFKVAKRDEKILRYMLFRKYKTKEAVKNVSFEINEGEIVGFIGPNGAGKSTTIKMMCGILVPSSGTVNVLGMEPYKNRKKIAKNIGVVFGQRSQLWWDLPPRDTYNLYKKIYNISDETFEHNLKYYCDLLEINKFIDQPVRQLSLGQRMRADFCASLLHDPKILFLDEPTIGLDVSVKKQIRDLIKEINKEKKITVVLTTHDMKDIDEVCDRIIMINDGRLVIDKPIENVKNTFRGESEIVISTYDKPQNIMIENVNDIKINNCEIRIRFDANRITAAEIINYMVKNTEIENIVFNEPEIDDIIRNLYENN